MGKENSISRLDFWTPGFSETIIGDSTLYGAVAGWRTSVAQIFFLVLVLDHTATWLPKNILERDRVRGDHFIRFFEQLLNRIRILFLFFFIRCFFALIYIWPICAVIASFHGDVFRIFRFHFVRVDSVQQIGVETQIWWEILGVWVGHHDSLPGGYRIWLEEALGLHLVGEEPGCSESPVVEMGRFRRWGNPDCGVGKVGGVLRQRRRR